MSWVTEKVIRKFISFNSKVCILIRNFLPQAKKNLFGLYLDKIAQKISTFNQASVILDVGAGKSCKFAKYKNEYCKIIGIDISDEELQYNNDLDEKIVANISKEIPLDDNSVDLLVSRSVLEHIPDLTSFITLNKNVLKPDGYSIHLFPSKFALFAVINQLLPAKISKKIINKLYPETIGICGFPAKYDKCYYSAIKEIFEKNDFEIEELNLSYYQSEYFKFFTPFYLISALYEMILYNLGLKNLAAYILIVAKKKGE